MVPDLSQVIYLSAPLILVLLSLAFMPLIAPNFWHRFDNKILGGIAVISVLTTFKFIEKANDIMEHTLIEDYVPFIIMLFSLYVLSNGINVKIKAIPNTLNNIIFLGLCSIFSSVIGTTGASMLLLKPFIEMNRERKRKTHLMVFFIFMVSNIGGILTPLGDPPLLLGYLHGVEFFWCLKNLGWMWIFYITSCLAILAVIDSVIISKEKSAIEHVPFSIEIKGFINIVLILITVTVLFSDINMLAKNCILLVFCLFSLTDFGRIKIKKTVLKKIMLPLVLLSIFLVIRITLGLHFVGIDIILLAILAVMFIRKHDIHHQSFTSIDLEPFKEVAITFFIIFIVMAPVSFVLTQFSDDIHRCVMDLGSVEKHGADIYFWLCGVTSSFLDNAPSYLLFFNMAGGNPDELMYVYTDVLKAISTSAVVMGAMTYIGNAPNMMVRSVALRHKIKMPSFVGYIGWAMIVILPLSIIVSLFLL